MMSGVGIAIHKSLDIVIGNILHPLERFMVADIVVCDCKIQVISPYATTEKSVVLKKKKRELL